ncbi:hypothetical protein TevJSym_bh00050 [endosymbiont of Tevnia jerichonana (vent Tica)]|uniref:Uncharacterized protein n=1 Tax=endosymbiont of Tevnia jerichonana (vent Tica) TaxID=1049564 RepID=G2FIW5_9GAMM|nr:hypothetical protein TevJSym_bh00050 [endosymbiont of Tevnia jerichonana (vent Tica)]
MPKVRTIFTAEIENDIVWSKPKGFDKQIDSLFPQFIRRLPKHLFGTVIPGCFSESR